MRRRPSNARPSVTSSAYSRSPPTGSPLASRETARPIGDDQPGQVGRRRLALEVRVGGDDQLGDGAVHQPGHELLDPQVVGAHAVDRADRAAEHVVAAAELAGALDGDDVLGLLDDAQDVVDAARVAADAALLGLGDVVAGHAEADLLLHPGQRGDQPGRRRRTRRPAGGRRSAGRSSARRRAAGRARRSGPGRHPRTRCSSGLGGQKPGRPRPPPAPPPRPPASGPMVDGGELVGRALGVVQGGDDEVLQRLEVVGVDGGRRDGDGGDVAAAGHRRRDQAAAGRAGDLALRRAPPGRRPAAAASAAPASTAAPCRAGLRGTCPERRPPPRPNVSRWTGAMARTGGRDGPGGPRRCSSSGAATARPTPEESTTSAPTTSATTTPATTPPAAPAPTTPAAPAPVVVLDPGHNGGNAAHPEVVNAPVPDGTGGTKPCNTTGTETDAGFPEHAFTWDVALRMRDRLTAAGVTVVLTRAGRRRRRALRRRARAARPGRSARRRSWASTGTAPAPVGAAST